MRDRIESLGRILFAAAQADGHIEAAEVDRILALLEGEWVAVGLEGPVAPDLLDQLGADLTTTSMPELARPFRDESETERRRLLELVVKVHEADGELDYEEDTFVRELGLALGLAESQFGDLLLEIFDPTPGHEPPGHKPAKAPAAKKAAKPKAKAKPKPKPKAKKKAAPKAKAKPKKKPAPKAKAKKKSRKR